MNKRQGHMEMSDFGNYNEKKTWTHAHCIEMIGVQSHRDSER